MTDPVELLARVISIAEQALAPAAGVTVPLATLLELAAQVRTEMQRPCASADDRVIGDEVGMLTQCLVLAECHRLDIDIGRATRWRTLAQCFLPFMRTDLARWGAGRQILR